jgi:hypothetical protein
MCIISVFRVLMLGDAITPGLAEEDPRRHQQGPEGSARLAQAEQTSLLAQSHHPGKVCTLVARVSVVFVLFLLCEFECCCLFISFLHFFVYCLLRCFLSKLVLIFSLLFCPCSSLTMRYPTFHDALRDLDDALCMAFMFARMNASSMSLAVSILLIVFSSFFFFFFS